MALRDIITKYLSDTGISQRELAKRAGLSPQTITNILKEDRQIDLTTYQKLARAMGKNPADLFVEEIPEENDDEVMEYLYELRTRPEMKMLFDSSRHMSIDQVKAIVAMIERFK